MGLFSILFSLRFKSLGSVTRSHPITAMQTKTTRVPFGQYFSVDVEHRRLKFNQDETELPGSEPSPIQELSIDMSHSLRACRPDNKSTWDVHNIRRTVSSSPTWPHRFFHRFFSSGYLYSRSFTYFSYSSRITYCSAICSLLYEKALKLQ